MSYFIPKNNMAITLQIGAALVLLSSLFSGDICHFL